MKKLKIHFSLLLLISTFSFSKQLLAQHPEFRNSNTAIEFVANKGQISTENSESIIAYTNTDNIKLYFTEKGPSYVFKYSAKSQTNISEGGLSSGNTSSNSYYLRMDMRLLGSNPKPQVVLEKQSKSYSNYFLGTSEQEHLRRVPHYRQTRYIDIYPNIDLVFYTEGVNLEYDFIIKPGGDPGNIRVKYVGSTDIKIRNNGDLFVDNYLGFITESSPKTFQILDPCENIHNDISSSFSVSKGGIVSFNVAEYDKEKTLVIDPCIKWSTYLGGTQNEDYPVYIEPDLSNWIVSGTTASTNFPTTAGVFQQTAAGQDDCYVSKFDKNGNLIWSTYFGGTDDDVSYGLGVDSVSNIYFSGSTASTDFPVSVGAFQTTHGGTGSGYGDVMIVKLDSTGDRVWATFFGGNDDDKGSNLCLDDYGSLYITGYTYSTDFPTTPGAYQTNGGGFDQDIFIAKLDTSGNQIWTTYYAPLSINYRANDITAEENLLYIAGIRQPDALVLSFDTSGVFLWEKTYAGTAVCNVVKVGPNANVYVIGSALSAFPTAGNSYQPVNGGGWDFIIMKLNSMGSTIWSTFFGGTIDERGMGLSIASDGLIMCGYGGGPGFPIIDSTLAYEGGNYMGGSDVYLLKMDFNGTPIMSSYFGGTSNERSFNIHSGNDQLQFIFVGSAYGLYPTTPNAFQLVAAGFRENYITQLLHDPFPLIQASDDTICQGDSALLDLNIDTANYTVQWQMNGSDLPGAIDSFVYVNQSGVYTALISCGLQWTDTTVAITITVTPKPSTPSITQVGNDSLMCSVPGDTYLWFFNGSPLLDSTQTIFAPQSGNYQVVVSVNGCPSDTSIIFVFITGINNLGSAFNYFTIQPNPTEGKFTISSRQGAIKKVEVYDLFGRKVLESKQQEIDMRGYAKGVYFIRVGEVVRKLVLH